MRGMRAIQVSSYALEVLRVLLAEERLAGQDMDGSTNGKAPVPMRGDKKRRKTEQKKMYWHAVGEERSFSSPVVGSET